MNKGRSKEKSKSTNCRAKLDIKIKKQTCDTRKKDEFLKLKPPLPTIIKLNYCHNHTTEFVEKRENFLADFSETQNDLKVEFARLSKLVSKSKPGLSAMKQLAFALKQIKSEAELYEAMRRVRLKPNVFTRVGRPPKKRPLLELKTKEPREKKSRKLKKTPEIAETGIEQLVSELNTEHTVTTISIPEDIVDSTHQNSIDISFLFN